MSLLYNVNLSYDAPSIIYSGNIGVSPTSILNAIQIGDAIIASFAIDNQSSLTTIGVTSFDLVSSAQITMEVAGYTGTGVLSIQPSGTGSFGLQSKTTAVLSLLQSEGTTVLSLLQSEGTAVLSLQQI